MRETDHITAIRKYLEVLVKVDDPHILIVEGPSGWGKTTAVEEALRLSKRSAFYLGSYSTPLHLFNFLAEHSNQIVVIDDCAGLFHDVSAMAILKAATWPSRNGVRVVRWGSTSKRADVEEFQFEGKIIVVCNSFPNSPDGKAIRSRGLYRKIDVSVDEARQLLKKASSDGRWFSKTHIALEVADYLSKILDEDLIKDISFRTLKQGYRLAECHPDDWQELFSGILPKANLNPEQLVRDLDKRGLKVKDQAQEFTKMTGLKTRSFFYYRKITRVSRSART